MCRTEPDPFPLQGERRPSGPQYTHFCFYLCCCIYVGYLCQMCPLYKSKLRQLLKNSVFPFFVDSSTGFWILCCGITQLQNTSQCVLHLIIKANLWALGLQYVVTLRKCPRWLCRMRQWCVFAAGERTSCGSRMAGSVTWPPNSSSNSPPTRRRTSFPSPNSLMFLHLGECFFAGCWTVEYEYEISFYWSLLMSYILQITHFNHLISAGFTFKSIYREITAICTSVLWVNQQKVQKSVVTQAPTIQFSMKLIKPPDGSCSSSAASFVGVGEAVDSWDTCVFGWSPILKAGRVQPAQVQCPAAPSALLLPWGDPRGCFTYSSAISCLFSPSSSLQRAIFIPLKHDTGIVQK